MNVFEIIKHYVDSFEAAGYANVRARMHRLPSAILRTPKPIPIRYANPENDTVLNVVDGKGAEVRLMWVPAEGMYLVRGPKYQQSATRKEVVQIVVDLLGSMAD